MFIVFSAIIHLPPALIRIPGSRNSFCGSELERRELGLGLGRISKGNESSDPNYGVFGWRQRLDCRWRRCCIKCEYCRGMSGWWHPECFFLSLFFPLFSLSLCFPLFSLFRRESDLCLSLTAWELEKGQKRRKETLFWPSFPLIYPTSSRVFSLLMPCISPLT